MAKKKAAKKKVTKKKATKKKAIKRLPVCRRVTVKCKWEILVNVKKIPPNKPRWFRSLKAALDYASENKLRMIKVIVQSGTYSERLQITRPTTIEGKISNNVILEGYIKNGDGHALTLSNLRMQNCRPYSLIQRGGFLTLKDFEIHNTRRRSSDSHSGIAIDVGDGVVGRFRNVTLNSNKGLALLVHGEKTKVLAFRLTAKNNQINPKQYDEITKDEDTKVIRMGTKVTRMGAVEVADGALLLAMNPVIEDNQYIGLFIRDGGRAHLRSGRVTKTKSIDDSWGGINVSVRDKSKLELRNMWIAHAQLAGLQNVSSWAKTSDTIVEHNRIGVHIRGRVEPDYEPLDCLCRDRTVIRNNERDFDSDYWSIPDMGIGESEEPNCPGVPWEF